MELIYLWLEHYNSFHNEEFCFSPTHRFSYHAKENTLTYLNKGSTYDNFFNLSNFKYGKISNVSAIVGGNGSGKTTLFRAILNLIQYGDHQENAILIFYDQKHFHCYTNRASLEIMGMPGQCQIKSLTGSILMQHLKTTQVIYSSNVFDSSCLHGSASSAQISDISNNGLLNSDLIDSVPAEANPLTAYYHADFIRQLEFICHYPDDELTPLIQLPTILQVRLVSFEPLIQLIRQSMDIPEELDRSDFKNNLEYHYGAGITNLLELLDTGKGKNPSLKNHLTYGFLLSMLCHILPHTKGGNSLKKNNDIDRILFDFAARRIRHHEIYDNITDMAVIASDFTEYLNQNLGLMYLPLMTDSFQLLLAWFDKHSNILSAKLSDSLSSFTIQIDLSHLNPIREFYILYRQSASLYHYLTFSWPLSTGEYHILSLFSRFYSLTERKQPKSKRKLKLTGPFNHKYADHAIILLDEADISLHPKWQQKYLKLMMSFFCDIFYGCSIQILLSTHSPIMLSDIPLADTVYLSDYGTTSKAIASGRKETFGANIYQIYNNYYFLDQNYSSAMIGDFAREHIEKLSRTLDHCEALLMKPDNQDNIEEIQMQLDYCSRIICILGEDIIKDILSRKCSDLLSRLHQMKTPDHPSSDFLENFKIHYRELSETEKQNLIRYIITEET